MSETPNQLIVNGRWKKHEKFWRATAEHLAELEKQALRNRRQVAGRYGERLAEDYFVNTLGAKLLERNYHTRLGEIDLLFDQAEALVAVEVKTRDINDMVHPLEALSRAQCRRIVRVLMAYAQDYDVMERAMRIDLVGIVLTPDGQTHSFDHWVNVYPG